MFELGSAEKIIEKGIPTTDALTHTTLFAIKYSQMIISVAFDTIVRKKKIK